MQLIFRHDPLLLEQLLSLTNNNSNAMALMKFYLQTRKFDELIDYQLILAVIKYTCQIRSGMLKIDLRVYTNLFR
jgi:hypothetical protein